MEPADIRAQVAVSTHADRCIRRRVAGVKSRSDAGNRPETRRARRVDDVCQSSNTLNTTSSYSCDGVAPSRIACHDGSQAIDLAFTLPMECSHFPGVPEFHMEPRTDVSRVL